MVTRPADSERLPDQPSRAVSNVHVATSSRKARRCFSGVCPFVMQPAVAGARTVAHPRTHPVNRASDSVSVINEATRCCFFYKSVMGIVKQEVAFKWYTCSFSPEAEGPSENTKGCILSLLIKRKLSYLIQQCINIGLLLFS